MTRTESSLSKIGWYCAIALLVPDYRPKRHFNSEQAYRGDE